MTHARLMCWVTLLFLAAAAPATGQTAAPSSGSTEALGQVGGGLLTEPRPLRRAVEFAGRWETESGATAKDGFYPELGDMVTGAGWISAGPGYRKRFADGQVLIDASAAISWRAYKLAQARLELPRLADDRLTIGSQVRWQDLTQINYFGIGPDSLVTLRSDYRLKDTDVLGYATLRPSDWLSIGGRFGWLRRPTLEPSAGPFDRTLANALEVFAQDPGVVGLQPSFVHGDLSIEVDTRDYPGHPTDGGYYRAAAAAFSDRDRNAFSFRRYDAEGVQFVPLAGNTWVLALHGWGVFTDTSAGNEVPFYFLPSLGGQNSLRGFYNYRFHDRHLLLVSAESRWALFRHVDVAAFVDAGNVAPRVGDLNLDQRSYGVGLRVHTGRSTLGRLDVGHGNEGWRIWFSLQDVFRLSRRGGLKTIVPFVP